MFYEVSDEWAYCFFFLLFIIFAFLLVVAMINKYTSHDEPVVNEHIDPYDLTTGDILGVAYPNLAGAFVSSFSGSIWSHTGIVWVDPDTGRPYVMEGAVYPDARYQGAFKIPFNRWYRYNRGFILGIKKYIGTPIDARNFNECFKKYEGKVNLEGFNMSWGRFLVNKKYYEHKLCKTYTCYEINIMHLQSAGIYKKERLQSSYFPDHIMNGYIPLEDGAKYKNTVRFFIEPCTYAIMQYEKRQSRKKCKN